MTCVLPVPQQHTGAPDSTHYLLVKFFMRGLGHSCEGQSKHAVDGAAGRALRRRK